MRCMFSGATSQHDLIGMSRHSMAKLDSLLGGRVEWRAFRQFSQKAISVMGVNLGVN